MRIPDVRRKLSEIANNLRTEKVTAVQAARSIDAIVTELWRKSPRKRPPGAPRVVSTRITPELKIEIRAYAKEHKAAPLQAIANHFRVNPGRVSEIVSGMRK
jgi:hypothetical protein